MNCILCQHFDWDLTHKVLFLYILPSNLMNLRDQPWRCTYFGAELTFVAAKVSLMLDNPFPVLSICKLNHISVCFIQIRTKITCKELIPFIPFRESHVFVFFEVIPGVLGRSVNFDITYRFLLRRPVFPDYHSIPFLMTMVSAK